MNFNFKPDNMTDHLKLYYKFLSTENDFDNSVFLKSASHFMINGKDNFKRFPDTNDFLLSVSRAPHQLADKAWQLMTLKWIPIHGRYKSINIGSERRHMALYETIDFFGGWYVICEKSSIDLDKLERKFKHENHLIGIEEKRNHEFKMVEIGKSDNLIQNDK